MYRVYVDDDEDGINNVKSWYVEGGVLILTFEEGSARGISGFVEFIVEQVVPN